MLVKEVMQPDAEWVTPDTPVSEVARRLSQGGISGVPVLEAGQLVGVVSLRDLVRHSEVAQARRQPRGPRPYYFREVCAEPELDLDALTEESGGALVRDIMAPPLYTVDESDPLETAVEMMTRANIHRVIVRCASGAPGILTTTDVMKLVPRLLAVHPGKARC